MLPLQYLKTVARNFLLVFLYASAFYLSVQVQMSVIYQTSENAHQPVFEEQSINILPFQEQNIYRFDKPVNLLPVIVLPVSGLFYSLIVKDTLINSLFRNHSPEMPHTIRALEITFRNLRI